MFSLNEAIARAEINLEPFPHIVVDGTLPEEHYERLSADYPPLARFVGEGEYRENFRYNLFAQQLLNDGFASSVRSFVQVQTSYSFYATVLQKFRGYYIELLGEAQYAALLSPERVGLRKQDTFSSHDVLLDSTFAVNTPNRGGNTSVRGPHIDKLFKLYAGLYYLRREDDASQGVDLELFVYKRRAYQIAGNDDSSTCGGARIEIDPGDVDKAKVIEYRANRLVLYPNSVHAIHGVSVRGKAKVERRLITLVADYEDDILDIER